MSLTGACNKRRKVFVEAGEKGKKQKGFAKIHFGSWVVRGP